LFGRTLTWLRLTPATAAGADITTWKPAIRGAYLNAVWASATETLTRELLGSSVGEPNLRVRVARPPVLHDSLELRVRELLSEEERQALLDKGTDSVVYNDPSLPGDWVLWRRVADPSDEGPGLRLYSLQTDRATGARRH
jgi:hypothetical protein